jgi:hypothetical protein
VSKPYRFVTECRGMEETQNASSSENEAKGMDVYLGVEGSKSNGKGEEIDKEGNVMKIIERLQKDDQTHREDRKKLMKDKEQQGEFNLKLMKSLERIEKKLENESDSRKTGSNQASEGRISRSVGRHHHHSQGRSNRRTHNSSSPSPTKKHRRSGVDELKGEMNKINSPMFDGEHQKEECVETWLLGMMKYFQLQNYSSCRRKNCNVSTERKGIHVVGSTCAGATH